MASRVILTEDAKRDLEDIALYIAKHDSPSAASHVLNRLLESADSLSDEPTRGSTPKEFRGFGDQEFRQILFKPYCLIHRVVERQVVIYVIVDARRHMQTLLARRLLGG